MRGPHELPDRATNAGTGPTHRSRPRWFRPGDGGRSVAARGNMPYLPDRGPPTEAVRRENGSDGPRCSRSRRPEGAPHGPAGGRSSNPEHRARGAGGSDRWHNIGHDRWRRNPDSFAVSARSSTSAGPLEGHFAAALDGRGGTRGRLPRRRYRSLVAVAGTSVD